MTPILTKQQRRRAYAEQMTRYRIKSLVQSGDRCVACQAPSQDTIDTYEQPIASERLLRAAGLGFAFENIEAEETKAILSSVGPSLPFCLTCAAKYKIPLRSELTRCACRKKTKYFCDKCDAPMCGTCRTQTGFRLLGTHELLDTIDVCPSCTLHGVNP